MGPPSKSPSPRRSAPKPAPASNKVKHQDTGEKSREPRPRTTGVQVNRVPLPSSDHVIIKSPGSENGKYHEIQIKSDKDVSAFPWLAELFLNTGEGEANNGSRHMMYKKLTGHQQDIRCGGMFCKEFGDKCKMCKGTKLNKLLATNYCSYSASGRRIDNK